VGTSVGDLWVQISVDKRKKGRKKKMLKIQSTLKINDL
jgi:hypothetical protein